MSVVSAAKSHWNIAMKFGLSLFSRGFNSSKCKTASKLAVARIKLLRNKRQVVVRQMRRDIASLLQSGQDATARVRVEHVIREQNIMAANEFIELFCELIVARLSVIAKQSECPADLKEGISSLIFAAPRCSDIPELLALRDIFEKKYGKDFVGAATDLRPNCGVNRMLINKLSVRTPAGEYKLKIMKDIAKEYQVEWDTSESESELLRPPEDLIEGPNSFVSASSLPVNPFSSQSVEAIKRSSSYSGGEKQRTMHFEDMASAAKAAAESAKEAVAAAQAAAYLANKKSDRFVKNGEDTEYVAGNSKSAAETKRRSSENSRVSTFQESASKDAQKFHRRHSYVVPNSNSNPKFDGSDYDGEIEIHDDPVKPNTGIDAMNIYRRHSYNVASSRSDIKFDESDCDGEEVEMEEHRIDMVLPPNRPAPQGPTNQLKQLHRIHPKLPDYDSLAARFEVLKGPK